MTTGVQMPVGGQIEVIGSSSSAICDTRRAAVLSPTHTDFYLVRSGSRCGRLCLSLTKASLVGQLAALLGKLPTAPLEFAPTIDLATGYGRSLPRYVLMAVADLEQTGLVLWSPTSNSSLLPHCCCRPRTTTVTRCGAWRSRLRRAT